MQKQLVLALILALVLAGAAFATPSVHVDQDLAYAPATGPPGVLATPEKMDIVLTGFTSADSNVWFEPSIVATKENPVRVSEMDGVIINTTDGRHANVTSGARNFPEIADLRGTKRPDCNHS